VLQIFFNEDLLDIALTARFGYVLDIVGFISSLSFCYSSRDRLSLYCFGAFGGHLLAIVGTFAACLVGINISVILMLTSCIQNISSTFVVYHLTGMIQKIKTVK